MIDRNKVKKELEEQYLGFIPETDDIEKLDYKLKYSKPVINTIKNMLKTAEGVHKTLLEWHLESVEDTLARAKILREILWEKYQ